MSEINLGKTEEDSKLKVQTSEGGKYETEDEEDIAKRMQISNMLSEEASCKKIRQE